MDAEMISAKEKVEELSSSISSPSTWAKPVDHLHAPGLPAGAVNLNVEGRKLSGPLRGFGQLWQKTYRVRLEGLSIKPEEVIKIWKEKFPEFWPEGNRFYGSESGIVPGDLCR